ncbi:hypothetical protein C8R43DRAFT_348945 [Mycena crocata]|nr:hypothetical protein C8R43DRAFT_348945 [Mycena crocata]
MATAVDPSRGLKSLSKQAFCHKCQVTKRVSELKICSRCQNAKYCSQECQKAHWKSHKPYCKSLDDVKLETEDESWKNISAEFGHKRTNPLPPVTESIEQQHARFLGWVAKWKPTILNCFVFELQRRAHPPTPEYYFEMHGAEIMHTSDVIFLLNHMKRLDILEQWRKVSRQEDTIQIFIIWKGHIVNVERHIPNFTNLRNKPRNDPVLLGYDALAKNWVEELRKAVDSADPNYHTKFYNQTWGTAAMEASFMGGLAGMRNAMDEIRAREEKPSDEVD